MPAWDLVGGNPAQGSPHEVRAVAGDLAKTSRTADDCLEEFARVADEHTDTIWRGEASEAFRDEIGDLPTDLGKLVDSYEKAAEALSTYADELDHAQRQASRAVNDAEHARHDADRARQQHDQANRRAEHGYGRRNDAYQRLYHYRREMAATDDPAVYDWYLRAYNQTSAEIASLSRHINDAESEAATARHHFETADGRLDAARRLASQARELREGAARTAARKIDLASEAGIQNKNFFEYMGESAVDFIDGVDQWLEVIGTVLAVAAVLVLVAILVVGTGGIAGAALAATFSALSTLSLATSIGKLLTTSFLFTQKRRDGTQVAFAAVAVGLDLIPHARTTRLLKGTGKITSKLIVESAVEVSVPLLFKAFELQYRRDPDRALRPLRLFAGPKTTAYFPSEGKVRDVVAAGTVFRKSTVLQEAAA